MPGGGAVRVIGASAVGGAVGLCVAEAVASRGGEVTVFERDRCGAGASAGNAGWITPSLAVPVPGPGVIGESLRWLVNPSGPLWIRPTLSPAMLAWIARFVVSCARPAYQRGLTALQRGRCARRAGVRPSRRAGVEFELHDEPLLYPGLRAVRARAPVAVADELRERPAPATRSIGCRRRAARARAALSEGVIGGMIARGDRRVRPETLCDGVHRALVAGGAEVLEQSPVEDLIRDGSTWIVESRPVTRRADAIVLAGGVGVGTAARYLGARLPIAAAKGYSRTYASDPSGPRHALYLEAPKVAISVFDGAVSVSGTLELGARSLEPERPAAGGDHGRGTAGAPGMADAARAAGLGGDALAVAGRAAVHRSGPGWDGITSPPATRRSGSRWRR